MCAFCVRRQKADTLSVGGSHMWPVLCLTLSLLRRVGIPVSIIKYFSCLGDKTKTQTLKDSAT